MAVDPHHSAAMNMIASIRSSSSSNNLAAVCSDACLDHLGRLWASPANNNQTCSSDHRVVIKRSWTITLVLLREFEHDGYLSFQQSREHTILETSYNISSIHRLVGGLFHCVVCFNSNQWRVARSSASLWHMILHACQSCAASTAVCDTDLCEMMASLLYYDVPWSSPDSQSKGLDSILQFAIEEKAGDTVIQWLCSAGNVLSLNAQDHMVLYAPRLCLL